MRRLFRGRAGMVLVFVLGLAVATAATAGASSLITGRQVKDGTIGARDLSKSLRKQVKRVGAPGPQGLQGPKGDPGPLTTTLPVGQTLRGVFNLDAQASAAGQAMGQSLSFGLSLRTAPTLVIRPVGAAANPQCPGSVGDPQATSGVLCVYLSTASNLQPNPPSFPDGLRFLDFPNSNPTANSFGAEMFIFSAAAGRFFADGTWAVTGN